MENHIKRVHEGGDSRICDICAKYFKCSKSYDTHYLVEHTNISQQVQCDLCGRWLKHIESLKEHKRRHLAENAPCPYCDRISPNKKSLKAHIKSAHADPAYPCTVCNKSFKKQITLKVIKNKIRSILKSSCYTILNVTTILNQFLAIY